MIQCLLHQRALRKHIDEGTSLPAEVNAHAQTCPDCGAILKAHAALSGAGRPSSAEPPFLHSRIMNALAAAPESSAPRFRWVAATAAVAVAATLAIFTLQKPAPAVAVAIPTTTLSASLFPKIDTTRIENPLEQEIENLREDTRNAAQALAASFLPFNPLE